MNESEKEARVLAGLLSTMDFNPSENHPDRCLPMAKQVLQLKAEPPPAADPQCWAFNALHQRCGLAAGHDDDHKPEVADESGATGETAIQLEVECPCSCHNESNVGTCEDCDHRHAPLRTQPGIEAGRGECVALCHCMPIRAEVERLQGELAGLRETLLAIKVRIYYVGMPQEPKRDDGRPDWLKEILLLEAALAPQEGAEKPKEKK